MSDTRLDLDARAAMQGILSAIGDLDDATAFKEKGIHQLASLAYAAADGMAVERQRRREQQMADNERLASLDKFNETFPR